MTKINSSNLDMEFKGYMQLGYTGEIKLLSIQEEYKNLSWENCKLRIDKYKSILKRENTDENILNLYYAIKGTIASIENDITYEFKKRANEHNITNLSINLGIFSHTVDIKAKEDKEAYINQQIDYLLNAIKTKAKPSIFIEAQTKISELSLKFKNLFIK